MNLPEWWPYKDSYAIMDCIEGMGRLPSRSIDLIIADPPYGIDFQSARRIEKERMKKIDNDKTPFTKWINEAYRILVKSGRLICFCRWDVEERFKEELDIMFDVPSQVVWDRGVHGLGDLNAQFAPQHDIIWYATTRRYEFKHGRPKSVLRYDRVSPDKLTHPNEKPTGLIKYLIEKLSDKNDVVLDPFLGSGTTLRACRETGRVGLGFEINPEYEKIIRKRGQLDIPKLSEYWGETRGS